MSTPALCSSCFEAAVQDGTCTACGAAVERDRDRRALPLFTEVGGKYVVGRVLGAGGFGITYLAQDRMLSRRVALKEFFPVGLVMRAADGLTLACNSPEEQAPLERGLRRFFREGQILARFNHPNIVRVYQVFEANSTAYLAMEFLDGMTLKHWITRVGRLPLDKALRVMGFVVDALQVVHAEHVVHRDVKPDNVYITHQGRTLLLDFGGAKQLTAEGDKTMDAMYAHGYAAPEQYFADSGKVGPWTDVYACGATLYKMLTGQTMTPALQRYSEDPPLDWGPAEVPPKLESAVARAVALPQGARFATIAEFEAALNAVPVTALVPLPGPVPAKTDGGLRRPAGDSLQTSLQTDPEGRSQPGRKASGLRGPVVEPPPPSPAPTPSGRRGLLVAGGLAALALAVAAGGVVWSGRNRLPAAQPAPAPGPAPPYLAPSPSPAPDTAPAPSAVLQNIDARLNVMISAAAEGDWPAVDAASEAIRKAQGLQVQPDAPASAGLAAGRAAIEGSDYSAAAAALVPATAEDPKDWRAWSALGYAWLRLNKPDLARPALKACLRLWPTDAGAWARLAEVLAIERQPAASAAALRLAVYHAARRERTLAALRSPDGGLFEPEFRAIIDAEGRRLDDLPPRKP